jgi:esterase
MTYANMAHDIVHFLDSQQIDQAILVGHSMGGKVAQAVALLHPDRVHSLCVLDIAPVQYTPLEPHWKSVTDIIETLQQIPTGLSKKQVDTILQSTIPDPALRAFCLTNWGRNQAWTINVEGIARSMPALADFPLTGAYEGDTFFIHGGQSRFVRHAYMDKIREYFPNHMLTTIRGSGHWVHAEAPEDTTALLKRFLDR